MVACIAVLLSSQSLGAEMRGAGIAQACKQASYATEHYYFMADGAADDEWVAFSIILKQSKAAKH